MNDETSFDLFWEESSLSRTTALPFAQAISEFTPRQSLRYLTSPHPDQLLDKSSGEFQDVLNNRTSARDFAATPLPRSVLANLLASVGNNARGGRTFAAAGGIYTTEILVFAARVDSLARGVWVYNPDNHSLGLISELPAWTQWSEAVGSAVTNEPAVAVMLLIDKERLEVATAKYQARAGRFVLLEVGGAMEHLALSAAANGIAGYSIGGVLDREILAVAGLNGHNFLVGASYICGVPMEGITKRKRVMPWSRK